MKTSRPILARIDPAALRRNYLHAKRLAPAAKAWAVVKADAYGHGLWRAMAGLREAADGFAVLEAETAIAMREAGIRQPILLLEGIFASRDRRAVLEYGLTAAVHCTDQLDMMLAPGPTASPLSIYLKLNTGMNRLGFSAGELPAALARLRGAAADITLMAHFAEADGARGVAWQMERFRAMTGGWRGPVSLANSASVLRHPDTHGDWVRPGIMLYGASPFADRSAAELGLEPVMSLESRIIAVQHIGAGERVGYGGTFAAEGPTRVGIVACGYADGYPRHAETGTPIAVLGRRTRTLGRVSMDMLACDLTSIPEAGIGAPVTLWGRGVAGEVPADEVASAAGTIAYELFCALAPRVPVEVGESGPG
ncbi:MAG: Alanine racemase region [Rhodocyclaceae bacterium]|nr:Alanine racemase region [Rhodocyclaceae bacterium]